MNEARILAEGRLSLTDNLNTRLFRNNVGTFRALHSEDKIVCGLCPGSSDLIGFTSLIITPDMLYQRVAVFVAAEAKSAQGKALKIQRAFLNTVHNFGGRAGVFRNNEQLKAIINGVRHDAD